MEIHAPLPSKTCPTCQGVTTKRLDALSLALRVDHYRCGACGTLWNQPLDTDGPIHIVYAPRGR